MDEHDFSDVEASTDDPAQPPREPSAVESVPTISTRSRGARRAVATAASFAAVALAGGWLAWRWLAPSGTRASRAEDALAHAIDTAPPLAATVHYDLILAGSDTIGGIDRSSKKGLARDLVVAFCQREWPGGALLDDELIGVQGEDEKDRVVKYKLPTGDSRLMLIRPHGSGTAAPALKAGADVGMASAPLRELHDDIDLDEHVIALDAVAVIVNQENPVRTLTLEQVGAIFRLDPPALYWPNDFGRIQTYGRDAKSGTTKIFKYFAEIPDTASLVYSGLADGQEGRTGYEDTSKVVDSVRANKTGIGFVGRAASLPADVSPLGISPGPHYSAFWPSSATIRTMEYPMSRELFFYTHKDLRPAAADFIRFCLSDDGQAVAEEAGFVGFRSSSLLGSPILGDRAPAALKASVGHSERVLISFRFRHGSSTLDTLSRQNLRILLAFLQRPEIAPRPVVLVGSVDSTGTRDANQTTSRQRAETFADMLKENGVENPIEKILGFGSDYLLYDDRGNPDSIEAQRNRRVDVYLQRESSADRVRTVEAK